MKDENYIKEYFQGIDTVSLWWNPEEGDYAHIFKIQEEIISKWFKEFVPKSCLEVSCGKGRITNLLGLLCSDYIATDISEQMLSIAKSRVPNVKFQIEDAENLSFENSSKDAVICLESLVHYPNPQKTLNEFYRVLKKDGILITDSDNSRSLRRIVKSLYGKQEIGADIFKPYSRKEFIEMINIAGFLIKEFEYVGVVSPIRIHKQECFYVISPKISEKMQSLLLDKIPLLNKLATYHLVLAKK